MILFDYRCTECETVSEHLVHKGTEVVTCTDCGAPAKKMIPAPRSKLEPFTGDFPGAAIKWAKAHEQGAKEAAKRNPDNG